MKKQQMTIHLSAEALALVAAEAALKKCSKSEAIESILLRSARVENALKEPEIISTLRDLDRKIFALHKTAKTAELLVGAIAALGKNEADITTLKAIKEAAKKRALDELKASA
ncbi:hypothetical protein AGMMS50229_08780 [Campylobacterota bacterium]|nr:hypothetical protein AGMMS50229_08780 [Campylobacterota bacterium]